MASKSTKALLVPIKYIFDPDIDSRRDLNVFVQRAIAFFNDEIRNEFNTTIEWSLRPIMNYGRNGVDLGSVGPIHVTISDNDLGTSYGKLLETRDLDEDSLRYTLRELWGEYLASRTRKLHDLVFHVDIQEAAP